MNKLLRFSLEDAADYFNSVKRTENEEYLLNIILQLGKEYNQLVEKYNKLVQINELLSSKHRHSSIAAYHHLNPYHKKKK